MLLEGQIKFKNFFGQLSKFVVKLHVKISYFGLGQTLGVGIDSELCMW